MPETDLFHLSDYEGAFNAVGQGKKVAFDCRLDDDGSDDSEDEQEDGGVEEEEEVKAKGKSMEEFK